MSNGFYISLGLQELMAYYSNRLSYDELRGLIERISGDELLSEQGIWNNVQQNVQRLSEQIGEAFKVSSEIVKPLLKIQSQNELDLYDMNSPEILYFDDGILVKAQKGTREKHSLAPVDPILLALSKTEKVNVLSDVVLLQIKPGHFEYIFPPIAADGSFRVGLDDFVVERLYHHYGAWKNALPLVVISDGAKVIRQRLERMLGVGVTVILDWYHLCKKTRDLMSMIAQNKTEKSIHVPILLRLLWQGKASEAIIYLKTEVHIRNPTKQQELLTYWEKHDAEIIDYERRSKAGKSIGSGRMEKAVDQVIGHRHKRKGMSWRPQGSRALALLKVLELNGEWSNFWFSSTIN